MFFKTDDNISVGRTGYKFDRIDDDLYRVSYVNYLGINGSPIFFTKPDTYQNPKELGVYYTNNKMFAVSKFKNSDKSKQAEEIVNNSKIGIRFMLNLININPTHSQNSNKSICKY